METGLNKICLSLMLITAILTVNSCGFKVKVDAKPVKVDAPTEFHIGPNFNQAASFCDTRYGANTIESESCFMDYRRYTNPSISFDFTSIQEFCEAQYTDQVQIAECVQDLTDMILNSNNSQ